MFVFFSTYCFAYSVDIDNDGIYDSLSISYNEEWVLKASAKLSSNRSQMNFIITPQYEDIDSPGYGLGILDSIGGDIVIDEHSGNAEKRYYIDFYRYDTSCKNWLLYKKYEVNGIFKERDGSLYLTDENINSIEVNRPMTWLLKKSACTSTTVYLPTQIDATKELQFLLTKFKMHENINISFFKLYQLISLNSISSTSMIDYNDLAYYLEKTKDYKKAIYLLEKIIKKFPYRMVAYYNIGDAYWNDGNKRKAKEAYNKYIELMMKDGKEKKVPQIVKDRVQ